MADLIPIFEAAAKVCGLSGKEDLTPEDADRIRRALQETDRRIAKLMGEEVIYEARFKSK